MLGRQCHLVNKEYDHRPWGQSPVLYGEERWVPEGKQWCLLLETDMSANEWGTFLYRETELRKRHHVVVEPSILLDSGDPGPELRLAQGHSWILGTTAKCKFGKQNHWTICIFIYEKMGVMWRKGWTDGKIHYVSSSKTLKVWSTAIERKNSWGQS